MGAWTTDLHARMADRLDFQLLASACAAPPGSASSIQTALGVVVVGVLMFNNIGGSLSVMPIGLWV